MAKTVNGSDAQLEFGSEQLIDFTSWSMSISRDVTESTTAGNSYAKTKQGGKYEWSGSADAVLKTQDADGTAQAIETLILNSFKSRATVPFTGTVSTFTGFDATAGTDTFADGLIFAGETIITNWEVDVSDGELVSYSVEFEGAGDYNITGLAA